MESQEIDLESGGGYSSEEPNEEVKMAVERELYQKHYQEIKVGEVINEFDVARQMKLKLIKKEIKIKDSELTALEKKERV